MFQVLWRPEDRALNKTSISTQAILITLLAVHIDLRCKTMVEGSRRSMWWSWWTVIGIFVAVGAIFARDSGASHSSWASEIYGDQMMHEVTAVKEYANQQGFEAELKVVSSAKDLEKYGPDIETLRVTVR